MAARELFDQLLRADSVEEVEEALSRAGYLDQASAWRFLGDNENSGAVVGAQQEDPVSALAEKFTNSVDAVLIDRCLAEDIDPTDKKKAPASYQKAIAKFFPSANSGFAEQEAESAVPWPLPATKAGTELVTMAVTGQKTLPSLSIADQGEGQNPKAFPSTFMSLIGTQNAEGNQSAYKARIPFTQGQFNMGGSGVLQFVKYQLVVSRRNPLHAKNLDDPRGGEWGFTVVRKVETDESRNGVVITYLAPIIDPSLGQGNQVLSFAADSLPLMPAKLESGLLGPYQRSTSYGSLVKLYEYELGRSANKDDAIRNYNSLMYQLETVLPMLGLQVRVAELRNQPKKSNEKTRTQWTPMDGLLRRIYRWTEAAGEDKLQGPPVSAYFTIDDVRVPWISFVKMPKQGEAKSNRGFRELTGKGQRQVVLHKNGQRLGHFSEVLHKNAGLGLLAGDNTIITFVDVSNLSPTMQNRLFSSNRMSLKRNDFRDKFEERLTESIQESSQLKAFQNDQRTLKAKSTAMDDETLKKASQQLVADNPALAELLTLGQQLSGKRKANIGAVNPRPESQFVGKDVPTFLLHKGRREHVSREYQFGRQLRLQLETDAKDDFFTRLVEAGELSISSDSGAKFDSSVGNLKDGALNVIIYVPEDFEPGTSFSLTFRLSAASIFTEPVCTGDFHVVEATEQKPGTRGQRKAPNEQGGNLQGSQLLQSGSIPEIIRRYKPLADDSRANDPNYEEWDDDWNEERISELEDLGFDDEAGGNRVRLHVNVDNKWLVHFQDRSKLPNQVVEKLFVEAFWVLSLGIFIQVEKEMTDKKSGEKIGEIQTRVLKLGVDSAPTLLNTLDMSARTLTETGDLIF